jgi:hypothetical protein
MPPALILIAQAIQSAVTFAPQIEDIIAKGKALVVSLFGAGVITKAQQDLTHMQIDQIAAAWNASLPPVAWTVEPDPKG